MVAFLKVSLLHTPHAWTLTMAVLVVVPTHLLQLQIQSYLYYGITGCEERSWHHNPPLYPMDSPAVGSLPSPLGEPCHTLP